jgi:hypothetical protein
MLTLLLKVIDPTGEKYFLAIQGHKFIQFVVSFLFVTRVTTALGRFNEARGYLEQLYLQSRKSQYCVLIFKILKEVCLLHCDVI